MNGKTIVIATVLAATMLMAAFAVVPVEASQDSDIFNDCGNGDNPIDVFCQGLTSQIIGADNDVKIDGDQGQEE